MTRMLRSLKVDETSGGTIVYSDIVSELPSLGRGVLKPRNAGTKFTLARHAADPALADWVAWFWIVRWDLPHEERFTQETLPYPCVNLVFERDGASAAWGVVSGRGSRLIEGHGAVLGIKLHPGAFYPLWRKPVSELTDRSIPLSDILGPAAATVENDIVSADDDGMIALATPLLLAYRPPPDANAALARTIVDRIEAERELTKVNDLLGEFGVGKRTLQRLFARYVGVSPKWVIQRYRLQEAAEKLAAGQTVDLSRLAAELGYFDQPHFVREFKALIGKPPSAYAREAR
jgi:AraC-like DNA-binding protein